MISAKALILCLAEVLHHEARGTDYKTKILVASVVMERVKQANSNICIEVNRPHAFSGFKKHKIVEPEDITSYKESLEIAKGIVHKRIKVQTGRFYFNQKHLGIRAIHKLKPIESGQMLFY